MSDDREGLADGDVTRAMRTFERLAGPARLRYPEAEKWHLRDVMAMREVLVEFADLRASPDRDEGARVREAPEHVVEALKREARDRAFRQELAESVLKSEREKWLRAGRLAMKGNLIALSRLIERMENPIPIHGSGPLAQEEKSPC